jgi:hypothetical protein
MESFFQVETFTKRVLVLINLSFMYLKNVGRIEARGEKQTFAWRSSQTTHACMTRRRYSKQRQHETRHRDKK